MSDSEKKCCVCGQALPNRWAIGGRCAEKGCEALFCRLHASQGNGQCQAHGWKEKAMNTDMGSRKSEMKSQERAAELRLVRQATADLAKKAMAGTLFLAQKIGAGAKTIWAKLHVDRSPEAMLGSLHGSLDENTVRREKAATEMEAIHVQIAAKKKLYQAAAPVRQRMLKTELQTLMAHYKSLEREFMLLSENEQTILTIKGRFMELIAHGLRGKVDEDLIDRLASDVEDKTDDAEAIQDAMGDLEKAGRRKDREGGDFDSELAGFGDIERPASTEATQEGAASEPPQSDTSRTTGKEEPLAE